MQRDRSDGRQQTGVGCAISTHPAYIPSTKCYSFTGLLGSYHEVQAYL